MEPSLHDIEDYNKPLSYQKLKTIALAFGGLIAAYYLVTKIIDIYLG